MNRDPIREQGGLNLYAFIRNISPYGWDKLGLDEPFYDGEHNMFAGSCCIGNKNYKASDRIPTGILVCREPGAIGHEYVVVEGLRIDESNLDAEGGGHDAGRPPIPIRSNIIMARQVGGYSSKITWIYIDKK